MTAQQKINQIATLNKRYKDKYRKWRFNFYTLSAFIVCIEVIRAIQAV